MTREEYLDAMERLYGSRRANKQMAELCGISHQMTRRISGGFSEVSPPTAIIIKQALRERAIREVLDND